MALVLSALTACSDPRAGTLPTTSPTPTTPVATSTSPTPDPAASLRAALRTYFDALYQAGLDPADKTDELAALIHPSCACMRAVDVLRSQAKERRYIDYKYELREITVLGATPARGAVRYTVHQSAGALREASGRAVETYPASTESYSAHFVHEGQRWLLRRVDSFR